MKKLVIAVLISAIASLGLVSCSAVNTEQIQAIAKAAKERAARANAEAGFKQTLDRYELARYNAMSPAQKEEFKVFNKWEQDPKNKEVFYAMTRNEGQRYDDTRSLKEKKKIFEEVKYRISPEGKQALADARKQKSKKERLAVNKFVKVAKRSGVHCKYTPINGTVDTDKVVELHKMNQTQEEAFRGYVVLLGNGDADLYIFTLWNKLCSLYNGGVGKRRSAGTALAGLPELIENAAYDRFPGVFINAEGTDWKQPKQFGGK